MYVKLFARITESSLMEEEIAVRYTFVMLLALADPCGLVVGTDIAISRRLNMPTKQFVKCIKALQSADSGSNSKESEGRRLIPSDGERGYQIVNYAKYRDLQSEDDRRAYMRDYMRDYRAGKLTVNSGKESLNGVNPSELELAMLGQAASDATSASDAQDVGFGGGGEDVGKAGVIQNKPQGYHKDARAALYMLNEASGRNYRETDTNLSVISARMSEPGVELEGVREMVNRQCKKWKGTTYEDFLRPITLFGKEKFDGYYAARNAKIEVDSRDRPPVNRRNEGMCHNPANNVAEAAKRRVARTHAGLVQSESPHPDQQPPTA